MKYHEIVLADDAIGSIRCAKVIALLVPFRGRDPLSCGPRLSDLVAHRRSGGSENQP